ncbi:hypothetical protein SVIOM74S_06159 [Streptomyces violarus]
MPAPTTRASPRAVPADGWIPPVPVKLQAMPRPSRSNTAAAAQPCLVARRPYPASPSRARTAGPIAVSTPVASAEGTQLNEA